MSLRRPGTWRCTICPNSTPTWAPDPIAALEIHYRDHHYRRPELRPRA